MPLSVDELVLSYRKDFGSYHNHKEQMAYGAAVLYLASAAWVIVQAEQIWKWHLPPVAVVSLLGVSAAAAFAFVIWQLRNRERAADIVSACTTLAAQLVSGASTSESVTSVEYEGNVFPKALADELDRIAMSRKPLAGARISEFITYVVMVAWSLGALVSLCRAA